MPRSRAPLLALVLAVLATAPALAREDRGAAFDKLFEQLDSNRLNPATPEAAKAEMARLRALLPPGDRRRELLYRSNLCFQTTFEDVTSGVGLAQQGMAAARALGDSEIEARFVLCQASLSDMRGAPQQSLPIYDRGIALARRSEHPALVGDGLVLRGNAYSYLGRHAEALADFIAAQRLYDGSRQTVRSEGNLQNIAVAYRRMGEHDRAREYLQRSREIAQRHADWTGLVVVALQTGFLEEDTGHPDRALANYAEALRISRQRMPGPDTASIQLAMASAQESLGRHAQALASLEAARTGFAQVGDVSNAGMLLMTEARARGGLGELPRALALFAQAEAVMTADGNPRYLEALYKHRASLQERSGNPAAALADYKRYLAAREQRFASMSAQNVLIAQQQALDLQRNAGGDRLRARAAREQAAQAEAQRWRQVAITLGVALLALLALWIAMQIRRTRRLRIAALTDRLTGVANRQRIEVLGAQAVARARADERPMAVIALEIDDHAVFVERAGAAADTALARVADACQRALRQSDELGRIEGARFLALLPDSDVDDAAQVADRLRAAVEALDLGDLATGLRATISLGATALAANDAALDALVARASQALQRARDAGRNCIRTM